MIYKKAGVLELNELRVIHLFEADLLVGLIFGRRTVHNAVDHQRLHPCQFGKKGGECMDTATSKTLHNDIATYTKTSLGQFESDATACFDIIVMTFAMLCFFAYGCPSLLINFGLQSSNITVIKLKQATASPTGRTPIPMPLQYMAHAKDRAEVPEATSFQLLSCCMRRINALTASLSAAQPSTSGI
jgi:hypothetical protein